MSANQKKSAPAPVPAPAKEQNKKDEAAENAEEEVVNDSNGADESGDKMEDLEASSDSFVDQSVESTGSVHENDEPVLMPEGDEEGDEELDDYPFGSFIIADEAADDSDKDADTTMEKKPEVDEKFIVSDDLLEPVELKTPSHVIHTPVFDSKLLEDFEKTVHTLSGEDEIAVEVEVSNVEYEEVVCFLVISTKNADFFIDTIALKEHISQLGKIFEDSNIVKVVLKPEVTLYYLKEHLNFRLSNVFLIKQAMLLADGPPKINVGQIQISLLIKKYFQITQVAPGTFDFRKRPLSKAAKVYLQNTTHYLLHLYHMFRNTLLKQKSKEVYKSILESMNDFCKKRFISRNEADCQRLKLEMNNQKKSQLMAYERLNLWRHRVGQVHDVNPDKVLDIKNLKSILMGMNSDLKTIIELGKSEYVRKDSVEIARIIQHAKIKFKGFLFPSKIKTLRGGSAAVKRPLNADASTANGVASKKPRFHYKGNSSYNNQSPGFAKGKPKPNNYSPHKQNQPAAFNYNQRPANQQAFVAFNSPNEAPRNYQDRRSNHADRYSGGQEFPNASQMQNRQQARKRVKPKRPENWPRFSNVQMDPWSKFP